MARVLSSSTLIDDRGREFPTACIPGTYIWDGRETLAELPNELSAACCGAVAEFCAADRPRLLTQRGLVWICISMVIAVLWIKPTTGPEYVGVFAVMVAWSLVFWWLRRSKSRRPYDERVLATLLAAARCPSCGYDLRQTEAAENGLTCCAECGAARKLPPWSELPRRRPGVPDELVSESVLPVNKRVSYADGRGRAVWLIDPSLSTMPPSWDAVPASAQARVQERLASRRSSERAAGVFGAIAFAAILVVFLGRWATGPTSIGISAAIAIGIAIAGIVASLRTRVVENGQAIAQAFLDSWLCPSCAHRFEDPVEEPDGCVTCPECHAAWRVRDALAESPGTV